MSNEFLHDVQPLLTTYNRKEVVGGGTDAFYVNLNISCFNMSCGYYEPHTDLEHVVIEEVEATLKFCLAIAKTMCKVYPFTKPAPAVYSYKKYGTGISDAYNSYYKSKSSYEDYYASRYDWHVNADWDIYDYTPDNSKSSKDIPTSKHISLETSEEVIISEEEDDIESYYEETYSWLTSKESFERYKDYMDDWEQLDALDYMVNKGYITELEYSELLLEIEKQLEFENEFGKHGK